MSIDVIRNNAMKISILMTECKYFTKYIFLCKLFLIKFPGPVQQVSLFLSVPPVSHLYIPESIQFGVFPGCFCTISGGFYHHSRVIGRIQFPGPVQQVSLFLSVPPVSHLYIPESGQSDSVDNPRPIVID